MSAARHMVRIEDVELEVLVRGPVDGPAVILLHGFPQTALMWDGLAKVLAIEGYRVIAPNQRGYGQSSNPRDVEAYDIERLAADVQAVARALGHKTYTIVGHDWGAAVGWWLASHTGGHLTGFVAISAPHPAVWRRAMHDDHEQKTKSRYVRFFGIPFVPEILIRLTRYAGLERAIEDAGAIDAARAACRRSWRRPGNLTGMLNWYRALLRRSRREQTEVVLPTLFIYGREDPFLSELAVRETARLGINVETVALDGGHWLVDRSSDEVRQLVVDFLQRASRRSTMQSTTA